MNQPFGLSDDHKQFHRERLRNLWKTAKWPYLPSPDSDLYLAACDLMEEDTYLAGCFQRIIDTGELPKEYHHLLRTDENLKSRLSASNDNRKGEFLLYQSLLNACIREAQKAISLQDTRL